MVSPFSDQPIMIVPREFGVILVAGGVKYDHEMSPDQQLRLATRFIEIATQRLRDEADGEMAKKQEA